MWDAEDCGSSVFGLPFSLEEKNHSAQNLQVFSFEASALPVCSCAPCTGPSWKHHNFHQGEPEATSRQEDNSHGYTQSWRHCGSHQPNPRNCTKMQSGVSRASSWHEHKVRNEKLEYQAKPKSQKWLTMSKMYCSSTVTYLNISLTGLQVSFLAS